MISDREITDRTFEFNARCNICKDRIETFRLRFGPGAPAQMKVLLNSNATNDRHSMTVSRDMSSEPFTLVFFDKFGNRTGPERGETWKISAEPGGPLESFTTVLCNPDGAVTIEDLRPKVSEVGSQKQTLVLTCTKGKEKAKLLTWEFDVTVETSRKPCSMKV